MAVELVKRLALGGGFSVGASVVYGAFRLLRDNPKDAFPLLRSWGPWAIVTLFAIYVIYDITKALLKVAQRGVIAMEQTSVALGHIADKDDRQLQELQTLTSYTSQGIERLSEDQRGLHAKMDDLLGMVSTRKKETSQ